MILKEFYQEQKGSSFTHDDKEYDLNGLLVFSENLPDLTFSVDKLTWILEFDSASQDRVASADLNAPIMVTVWESKFTVIDGLHRLTKAKNEKQKFIIGKYIPVEVLAVYQI